MIIAYTLLAVVLVTCLPRVVTIWKGFSLLRKLDRAPDDILQTYQQNPSIVIPMPFIPAQIFVLHPVLIRQLFQSSALDSLQSKRALAVYLFGMPNSAMRPGPMYETISTIENMYHNQLSPNQLDRTINTFFLTWTEQMEYLQRTNPNSLDLSFELHDMMVETAIFTFFGRDFPAENCTAPLRKIIRNMAAATVPAALPAALRHSLAPFLFSSTASVAALELIRICQDWLENADLQQASLLVLRTQKLTEGCGWTPRQTATMLAMLLFTVVANSSDAIGWLLTSILQTPLLRAKIECEAQQAVNSDLEPEMYFSLNALPKHMPHTWSAIQETLRIFTSPLTVRTAKADTVLSGKNMCADVLIPKGWRVVAPTRALNVDPSIWGVDARDWKAARFLKDDSQNKTRLMGSFGGGTSICTGRHFAVAELAIAITLLLARFRFGDLSSAEALATKDCYVCVDIDGTKRTARWAGALADPNAAQSGIFRAKSSFHVSLTPKLAL